MSTAQAHSRSESYSNWRIHDDTITATVTISTGELMRLMTKGDNDSLSVLLLRHLQANTFVSADSGRCDLVESLSLSAARGFERAELRYSCRGRRPVSLRYRAMFDVMPSHVHYARLFDEDGFVAEALLTDAADTWIQTSSGKTNSFSFLAFLDLGMRHILSGFDHLAFLLGMLLVAGTFRRGFIAVTGFTLGHSVSLAAAVLGYLHADGRLVEAFIGFTVALVAVEYFLKQRPSAGLLAYIAAVAAWLTGFGALQSGLITGSVAIAYFGFGVFSFCYLLASSRTTKADNRFGNAILFTATACFGVVHGFGFADFLMATGLTGTSLVLPLLGFNLGVEAGQLILIGVAFAAAYLLKTRHMQIAAPVVAAGLCGIGLFWFVGRSLAG